uniref:Chondroitin sulfate proteoglycan 4 n=2 Tax=Cacopsylla melanoneura TaxID=428564 RepID=A0A8D8PVP6_9HEMI
MFHIQSPPLHGTLHLEIWEHDAHAGQMFTLLDLAKDKVRYIHDGSESRVDSFQCEVALSPGTGFLLPSYLQGRHRFRFHIQITPVNDPPLLSIPQGRTLKLAQGTRKTLTPDLLQASDLDTPPSDLVFSVNQSEASIQGHLERDLVVTTSFSQQELSQGRVQYVHTGASTGNFKLGLQVSDGQAVSGVAYLSVSVHPLQLRQVNNTGSVLIHNSHTTISATNLSFSINSDDSEVVIVYKVTTPPNYGSLQTLKVVDLKEPSSSSSGAGAGAKTVSNSPPGGGVGGDSWQSASEFSDVQVKRGQVRYLHRTGTPVQDEFKFTVSLHNASFSTPESSHPHAYTLRFVQLTLTPSTNHSVPFHSPLRELLLSPAHLSYQTTPLPVPPNTIVYKIVRPVVYGNLSRRGNSIGLASGDMFTQAEINTGELYYSLHRTTYSNVTDTIEFQVSAPHCEILYGHNLSFVYSPDPSLLRKLTVTLNNLQVVEGGQERLSGSIVCHGVSSLSYRVTTPPRHGRLDLTEAVISKKLVARDIARFSGAQLSRSLILYTHDDSESRTDRVEFVAISSDKEDFQYIGSIHISVALTNDNAPHRSANGTLELVTGSAHLVLPSHLSYTDEDIDATPHNIIYSVRASEGGALYSAVKQTDRPLSEFSQADIDSGRVKYRHQSNQSVTSVTLRVSDGAHFVEGILVIHASPPYVRVVNSTRLVVKEGGESVLTPDHLNSETNVDMNPAHIKYDILEYPSYGELQFRAAPPSSSRGTGSGKDQTSGGVEGQKRGDLSITSFSQRDVNQGSLVYVQNGVLGSVSSVRRDVFKLRLDAGDRAWNDTLASVSIYPTLYYTPLSRTRNETLVIEESTGLTITRHSLLIEQPGVPARDVVYHVTQAPAFGYLELDPPANEIESAGSGLEPGTVLWFDQAAINEERLHYVQAGGQNRTQDYFLLDVTNGIMWIRGLQINIIIVPEHIYLSSPLPVHVDEAGNITLLPSLLPLLSPYYQNRVTEYRVIRQSKHGALYSGSSNNRVAIMRWTPQQLQAGQIQYIHDGSESSEDSFTLVARAGDKESNPATVHIVVEPVNDQAPRLVNNSGLMMYRGSTVTLTRQHLACIDLDTAPDNLTYTVLSSHHGHPALKTSPGHVVHNFTQAQINAGEVVFTHLGDDSRSGQFEALVSDSLHATPPFTFLVSVRVPSLVLGRSSGLSVFPMLSKVISSGELVAWSSDRERQVVYVVTQLPSHGFLHVNDKAAYELPLNFTQADVNASRVSYQHSSPFRDPDLNDTFRFNVLADYTEPILNQSFHIHISVSYGGLEHLVTSHIGLSVVEGGVSHIQLNTTAIVAFLSQKVGLNSPTLSLSLLSEPKHGKVCECRNNEHNRRKSRRDIDDGDKSMNNDGDDARDDSSAESKALKTSSKTSLTDSKTTITVSDTPKTGSKIPSTNSMIPLTDSKTAITDSKTSKTGSKTTLTDSKSTITVNETPKTGSKTTIADSKTPKTGSKTPSPDSKTTIIDSKNRKTGSKTALLTGDANRFFRDKRKSFDLEQYENNYSMEYRNDRT